MEEILASIRRIISEDDAPAAAVEAEPVAAVSEPKPEPKPEPVVMDIDDIMVDEPEPFMAVEEEMMVEEDDVLELTEVEPMSSSLGDLDIYEAKEEYVPEPMPAPAPVYVAPPAPATGGFEKAALAFGALSNAMAMPKDNRSLEDFMADIMRPMIKEWLDQNLARVVEDQVKIEIERVSRISRYKD
jgi:cell pole-organizing protein PopZ